MINLFLKDKKRLSLYVNIMLKNKDPKASFVSGRKLLLFGSWIVCGTNKDQFFKEQEATSV